MRARICTMLIVGVLAIVWIPVQITLAKEIYKGPRDNRICIMVAGEEKDGTPVQLSGCDGSSAQQWYFANNEIHSSGGLCLDADTAN